MKAKEEKQKQKRQDDNLLDIIEKTILDQKYSEVF